MSLSNETNKKPCFLINWSLTGKRGREPSSTNRETSSKTSKIPSSSSSSSEEEEDQQTAAHFLLMLSGSSTTASTTTTTTTSNTTKDDQDHHHHRQYRCGICDKSFGSHQALGGHRASHFKIMKTRVALIQDQPKPFYIEAKTKEKLMDQGLEDDVYDAGVKKRKKKIKKKKFECSICRKSFSSGQALGGHKRFHWSRNHIKPPPPDDHSSGEGAISSADPKDDDDNEVIVVLPNTAKKNNRKKKIRLISSLGFDLNLPPPSSSDKNEDGSELFSTTQQGSSPASPLMPRYCSC